MISKGHPSSLISATAPSPSFPKGTIINNVVSLIERLLVAFQAIDPSKHTQSEEFISQYLLNFFTHHAKSEVFLFAKEAIQEQNTGHNRRADIGVFAHYLDRSPFFTIEAKRLPTPGSDRYTEYVAGPELTKLTGGIERYKHNVHGVGINDSAIVGYIQDKDIDHWIDQINTWIENLIHHNMDHRITWNNNDKLVNKIELCKDKVCKMSSENIRSDKTSIKLFHYFIMMGA